MEPNWIIDGYQEGDNSPQPFNSYPVNLSLSLKFKNNPMYWYFGFSLKFDEDLISGF
jgi:hypothetical protein